MKTLFRFSFVFMTAQLLIGAPLLEHDYSTLAGMPPGAPAGVMHVVLPEGGGCLQLGSISKFELAKAAVEPGTKYRLRLRARIQGEFTIEQNERAHIEAVVRRGRLESAYTVQFRDPSKPEFSGGGGFFLTRDWYDYVLVFRVPAGVQEVKIVLTPRGYVTQVASVLLVADEEGGAINVNPDFRYGELNYCGWYPQRDGRLIVRPDGKCIFRAGYASSSPRFPLPEGRFYRITAYGEAGYLNINYYDADGKIIVTQLLLRLPEVPGEVVVEKLPPAGCVSASVVAYNVLLESFEVVDRDADDPLIIPPDDEDLADLYVSPTGNDANTGASWMEALATISHAVAQARFDDTILVSNGVYNISAEIIVTNAITLKGRGGADATHVRRTSGSGRVFQLAHTNAVLEGFTVSGGSNSSTTDKRGAGVLVTDGLLHACVISNNIESVATKVLGVGLHLAGGIASNIVVCQNTGKDSLGHGVYVENALLVDSVIRDNNRSPVNGSAIYRSSSAVVNIQAGGEVRDCRIIGNANGTSTFCHGGGVYIKGGTLRASVIANNVNSGGNTSNGGGIYLETGLVENCLIVSNSCPHTRHAYGGGGVYQAGGILVNCTIAQNTSAVGDLQSATHLDTAGGLQWIGGVISNTVIFGNTRLGGRGASDISGNPGFEAAFHNSCSPALTGGVQGNITDDPRFCDVDSGDYRLGFDSPCRDAGGLNGPVVDLLGVSRPQDGTGYGEARRDIGAYEAPDVNGDLNAFFSVDVREAFLEHVAVFTAHVHGANQNGLYYSWDFGNGVQEGSALEQVSQTYAMGRYDVSLTVSNLIGEVSTWIWPDCIRVGAPVAYVSPMGGHQAPFDTWAKAATNILAAVEAAVVTPTDATRVLVSNGLYRVNSAAESIFINRGIMVESLSGPLETVVEGSIKNDVYPNFDLDHPDAIVDGFASQKANFGAVVNRGTLRNCILRNNSGSLARGSDSGSGAGLRMYGGVAEGCQIVTNTISSGTGSCGAGVWMTGPSLLYNSIVAENTIIKAFSTAGAGVRCRDNSNRSVVRNCLIVNNVTGSNTAHPGSGGGVHISGGRLENCTVVGNRMEGSGAVTGGGLVCLKGSVTNTIFCNNVIATNNLPEVIDNVSVVSISLCAYSCASELTTGVQGNIATDPQFVDFAGGNYRLAQGSPCINAGSNQDWMVGAFDLDGLSRVNTRTVDMGVYEYIAPLDTLFLIR